MGTHTSTQPGNVSRRRRYRSGAAALAAVGLTLASFAIAVPANAVTAVNLRTAGSYSVLAGSTVTNTGGSILNGDLGLAPGSSITGFPPGQVNGATHISDGAALQAKADLVLAYDDAKGQASNGSLPAQLAGLEYSPGVYTTSGATNLSGTLTLNGQGNQEAVWVFQIGETLVTGSSSAVSLINGAKACNVFWQVGSSATLGTGTQFVGTIMAMQSITVTTGANVDGRALARNAAVTLDTNVFQDASCAPDTDADADGAVDVDLDAADADVDVDTDATDADTDAADVDADAADADVDADTDATDADTDAADVDADAADADVDADLDASVDVDTDAAGDSDVDADIDATVDADLDAGDADGAEDADVDATVDSDLDANVDVDVDAAADAAADADAAVDVDASTDADADAGADADADADADAGDADIDAGDADARSDGDADAAVDVDVDVDASTDTDAAVDVAPDWDVEEVVAPAPVTAAAPALAATGFDGMWLIPMGSVLLMGGAVLLIARRKRAER